MATSFNGTLVPYRGNGASTSTTLITTSTSTSLLPARLFTAQTGHAIAIELLYRLLFDILNRLLMHLHRFASRQLDTFSSFLERRWNERADALKEAREARKRSEEEGTHMGITEEVRRVAAERGFVKDGAAAAFECPTTGHGGEGRRKGPPALVKFMLQGIREGIREGRIVEKDFWGGNTFQI